MKKILYISWCMPYEGVQHAGGQNFNYFIKYMANFADVRLVSVALSGEKEKATVEKFGVEADYIEFPKMSILDKIRSLNSKFNPLHKYGGLLTQYKAELILDKLGQIKATGYIPDIIVLEWTQIVLLINEIKRIFPMSKCVASEVDVSYLRLEREMKAEKCFKRIYKDVLFRNEKKRELIALNRANIIYTNNLKDKNLLILDGISDTKIHVLVPFFHRYNDKRCREKSNKDILFFGDMSRSENYTAAIWFIDNILNKLEDQNIRFIVMGAHSEKLEPYISERVVLTGFVNNPGEYFKKSALFVAPLFHGAGIKIKVLEAMSSGIPVITSNVGIEGIPAKDGQDFIFYKDEKQLVDNISMLIENVDLAEKIGNNGRNLVNHYFNFENEILSYKDTLLNM